jgi:ribosomal subunit interface protein
MQTSLKITMRDFPHSEALDAHIRKKLEKLESNFNHIVSCHVVITVPHKHQHQGKQFNVRIELNVPGSEIVVNHDHHEDVYVALRDAFDSAKRQLDDFLHRSSRQTKVHDVEYIGRVVQLFPDEGYGYIGRADGARFYFHRDNLVSPSFANLKEGDEVKFIENEFSDQLQAKRVSVGKHHVP